MKVITSTSQKFQAGSRRRKRQASLGVLPPVFCDSSHGAHGWVPPATKVFGWIEGRPFFLHDCSICNNECMKEIDEDLSRRHRHKAQPSVPCN